MSQLLVGIEAQTAFFDRHVPWRLGFEMGRIVTESYPAAADWADANYGFHEAHDLRGYKRRADIEQRLLTLKAFDPTVIVEKRDNIAHNWYHTEIVCGPNVMTVSRIDFLGAPLPKALFRQTLARSRQLRLLLPEFLELPPLPETGLWAAIVHGCENAYARQPEFVQVVFPIEDGRHYERGIDLLARYPRLLDVVQQVEPETVKDTATPRLKTIRHAQLEDESHS